MKKYIIKLFQRLSLLDSYFYFLFFLPSLMPLQQNVYFVTEETVTKKWQTVTKHIW